MNTSNVMRNVPAHFGMESARMTVFTGRVNLCMRIEIVKLHV
jgi:hypothetical protein